ncbi:S-layer homology domain-containing protein [Flavonifractor hominis]|uniref:S-layer homology domain-containing protein n=1 Tax=Flavonifractor hominis TaxID=3133178 RepID=A0ABV1EMG2_9FIRM
MKRKRSLKGKTGISWLLTLAVMMGLFSPLSILVPEARAASSPKPAAPALDDFLVPVSQVTKVPAGYTGVYTAADLLAISDAPNENYILMADINLSGYAWEPLCNDSDAPFTGIFEGNGHVISNLKGGNGLFSYTSTYQNGAEIRNVGIENASISAQYEDQWNGIIGGIVAYATDDTTISNCYFQGGIDSNANMIGGIVGKFSSAKPVESCWMTGDIRSTNMGGSFNEPLVGGIIGQSSYSNLTVTNCIHNGSIESYGYASYVGGISGSMEGTISNCQNYGSITQHDQYAYIGGIVSGLWTPEIESCINAAEVRMAGNGTASRSRLGGITATSANISNCFNCGDITADGASYVGGITGENGYADNSYNVGTVRLDNPVTAGAFAGDYGCGALFGSVSGASSNCYYLAGDLPAYEKVNGTPTLTNLRSLTADQMKKSSSFGGFDFDNVWTMDSGSYPYPVLQGIDLSGGGSTTSPSSNIPTPIMTKVTSTKSGVQVSWTRPLDSLNTTYTIDGYYILRKSSGGSFQKIGETTGTSYMDTTAEEGRTYTYTVQAYYQGKTGSYDPTGLSITFSKPKEEAEWVPSAAVNTYVQDHVWFAESDTYDNRMDHRFAAYIAEAQSSGGQMAAEIAYDLLNTADEATNFQRLTILENPYDALMVELLSNMGESQSSHVALESEMVDLSNSVLELIYKMQPDYVPDDTFSTNLMDLFTEPESFQTKHPALYDTLKSAIDSSVKEVGREKTLNALLTGIEGVEGFATALAVIGEAGEVVDWFSDSAQYYLLVETYVNLGENTREVLRSVASRMSGVQAIQFRAALAKYEQYMTADELAAAFMKGGDIAVDLGGRLYDMVGAPAASFLATKYVSKLTGASVTVPLAAYHLGWAISNAITSNDQLVLSRTMIRANYHVEQAVYTILQENRSALLQNPNPNTALAFDAAYTILRQCELYALREYQDYLDASQKSMVQGILHLGNQNSNSYEIAIADREIIDWDLALCHGERVSDQHLGSNILVISGASEASLRNSTGKTLLEADLDGITEHGSSDVTGQLLSKDVFYLGIYANGLYNLRITPNGKEPLVVMYIQLDADMNTVKIDSYQILGNGTITGSLNAEVYGTGNGKLRLTQSGSDLTPTHQINNMDQMTKIKGISLEGKAQGAVTKGQAFRLEPQIQPSNASLPCLFWSSSNPAVATVDDTGLVTPLSAGTATIVAQAMDGSGCRLVYELTVDGTLSTFVDVPSNAWYADAVQWAVENGITSGTGPNTFSPDRPCTRSEVVTFLWRAFGLDDLESDSTDNPFKDVKKDTFYYDAVLWAAENNITTGSTPTTFSPNAVCSRAEVVTFLWRSDYPLKKPSGPVGFSDVHVGDYFWFPVKWALDEDITTGTSAATFSPTLTCTRAQVVTFLYRFFNR